MRWEAQASSRSGNMAPWKVAARLSSHRSNDGDASAEEKEELADLASAYQQQLDSVRLMRAMLDDDDMPAELVAEVNEEMAKLEAELHQLKVELGDARHDEALAGEPVELVRSWTLVELTEDARIQVAQHNRISDEVGDEYGDFLWSPAIAMARWMAEDSSTALDDKTVVELGAGLGLPGVVAATLGARQVLIQDQLAVSLQEATVTAARNGVEGRVSTLACTWEDLDLPVEFRAPDVILGSCLLYGKGAALALAGCLSQVLKNPGGQVAYIVAAEWEGWQGEFMDYCKEACLTVERSELHTWVPEQEAITKHALFTIRTAGPTTLLP